MSVFESRTSRRIRQIRDKIRYLENQLASGRKDNKELEELIRRAREEKDKEIERLAAIVQEQDETSHKLEEKISYQSETIRQMDAQMKERERLQQEKIRAMERQHQSDMQQLYDDFEDATGRLRASIDATREEMKDGFATITAETDAKIANARKEADEKIAEATQALQSEIQAVDQKVDEFMTKIRNKEDGEKQLATYWTEQAVRIYDELRQEYRPHMFTPKEIERLRISVRDIQNDLNSGRYTSAADGGRTAFYDAMDLKEELVAAEFEWNYWFQALKEREIALYEMLSGCENRQYEMEHNGETIVDSNGIDYWTGGQLSIIRERIQEFRLQTEDVENRGTEYIKERLTDAQGLLEELALVENAAHTNVAMSLSRVQMAGKIGAILGESYQMVDQDGDYFAEENREAYHALFENPVTGDQAVVVITPVMGDDGTVTNYMELIVGNKDNNPVTREQMSAAVEAKLRQGGVQDVSFPCFNKYGDKTREECSRVGNIDAVAAGDEGTRGVI